MSRLWHTIRPLSARDRERNRGVLADVTRCITERKGPEGSEGSDDDESSSPSVGQFEYSLFSAWARVSGVGAGAGSALLPHGARLSQHQRLGRTETFVSVPLARSFPWGRTGGFFCAAGSVAVLLALCFLIARLRETGRNGAGDVARAVFTFTK